MHRLDTHIADLTLEFSRRTHADIVPHEATRSPWVRSETLRQVVEEAGADARLLDDLADVREATIDDA